MSEKRRDNRNRILREGEYQRKDGRYRFRYLDEDGKEQNVYSWRLDKNDPMPKGKKREPSLREKEKQIEADLFDHIVTNGGVLRLRVAFGVTGIRGAACGDGEHHGRAQRESGKRFEFQRHSGFSFYSLPIH